MNPTRNILTVLSIGAFAVLAAGTGDSGSSGPASNPTSSREPAAPPTPMPADEQAFCDAVQEATQAYEAMQGDGANQLKLSKLRTSRGAALRAALPSRAAKAWAGTISKLSTNSDGQAVVAVELPCGVEVKTWNNALSDIEDGTLISQKSALFGVLADLKVGMSIQFSGRLFPDRVTGFKESSLTEAGSMKEPEFLMKFSAASAR